MAPGRGGTSVLPRLLLEILAAGLGVAVGGLVIRRRRGPRT
ncbi:MAG TPA: hypothetical protein VFO60_12000 [Candidatus Dormibacteraeota bacterium]|nr:hypothetical protein [Candidatus Dormibacteraeota bacterium]